MSKHSDHIAVLTQRHDVDPQLASALRKAAHRGQFNAEQTEATIAMLRELPARQDVPVEVRMAWTVDAYEKQRTAALRTVRVHLDMLRDAQHALANNRLAVVEEFVGRTADALDRVVAGLAKPPEID